VSADTFRRRVSRVSEFLRSRGLDACLLRDEEARRDPGLRYLCGHPADAVLAVTSEGRSALAAWDVNLARLMASADSVLSYTDYDRSLKGVLSKLLPELGLGPGSRIELPPDTYYPEFASLEEAVPDYHLSCREDDSAARLVQRMRAVKDQDEIALYRRAAALTDRLLADLEAGIGSGAIATESRAALFLEEASRGLGCEGMGFETLCAGPARSFGIHAFPNWTAGGFAGPGLSILDFGLKLEGYATDVTLTVARGKLAPQQEKMLALVEKAYDAAIAACRPGRPVIEASKACDEVFASAGWKMPHALGHGIGLEAHEAPVLRDKPGNDWLFEPGMVFTLEPGLYHPDFGGARLENDFLMTEEGPERLTSCRILRLD
jgi:Xaa-Pro dipeptidase